MLLAHQLGMGGPSLPPEDPVLRRLLPDAYGDDQEESAEFRRFTERSLTSAKVENAERLIASLEAGGLDDEGEMDTVVEVELDPADVQAWLRSLTDIRLSIAVRLGIDSEADQLALAEGDDPADARPEGDDWSEVAL